MRVLLVSPRSPATFWSFSHVLPLVGKKAAFPPLGLLTVAGMLPDDWDLRVVDMNVSKLDGDDLAWADAVFVSAMIVQEASARDVIEKTLALGKPVVAGGPLFTTDPDRFGQVSALVIGEAEEVMEELVADLVAGNLKKRYQANGRPDVSLTPLPRWDLIDTGHYFTMSVQSSRGCPFDCEFCDITAVYGRVPRVKSPEQMIDELDALIDAGWRGPVFMVDDNFIGNKVKSKALLRAIIEWRAKQRIRIGFTTEASMNLADDAELVALMVEAGFKTVFMGIESPQEASLQECRKVQNTKRDLVETVRSLHKAGIEVMAGFILGFDNDRPNIFELQRRFIQESGIATAMVGLLNALPGTRLFTRLTNEGRLIARSTGNNLDAILNFVPTLDATVLTEGYRHLLKQIYAPGVYYQRVRTFLADYRPTGPRARLRLSDLRTLARTTWVMGVRKPGRWHYWKFVCHSWLRHREAFREAIELAIRGHHFRLIAAGL
jgi:radical SAM superfamily enzyme YgiQ (UPF0313 family)